MHSPVSVPVNILNPKNVNLRASLVAEQLANHGENSSSDKVPTSEKNSETMAMNPFTLHMQVVEEVIDGIMEYFNLSLGALLLYSTERLQYKQVLSQLGQQTILPSHMADSECVPEPKELVDLYGSHHLLRLFTKLPEMISKLPMATGTLSLLKEHFTMILKYLDIFAPHLFQEDADYCNLSPDQILQLKSIQ